MNVSSVNAGTERWTDDGLGSKLPTDLGAGRAPSPFITGGCDPAVPSSCISQSRAGGQRVRPLESVSVSHGTTFRRFLFPADPLKDLVGGEVCALKQVCREELLTGLPDRTPRLWGGASVHGVFTEGLLRACSLCP